MKRYAALLLIFFLGFLMLFPKLTAPAQDYAKLIRLKKEPKWQGIVDIWLCETFYPGSGSFYPWLYDAFKAYEKKNEGVYINLERVAPFSAKKALRDGKNLPDMLICGPGIIDGIQYLSPIECQNAYEPFQKALEVSDLTYGAPIAAGGYTAIAQKEKLEGKPIALSSLYFGETPALSCPKSELIAYSLAAVSMFDIRYEDCQYLSKDIFRRSVSDAWADFVLDKKSYAYVCTQKEVYRMRKLEAGGSAFAWQGLGCASKFTDQLLCAYITSGNAASTNVLKKITEHLQSSTVQAKLKDAGAFSINSKDRLYDKGSVMRSIEDMLVLDDLIVPNMFTWSNEMKTVMRAEESGADAADSIAGLNAVLDKLRDLR